MSFCACFGRLKGRVVLCVESKVKCHQKLRAPRGAWCHPSRPVTPPAALYADSLCRKLEFQRVHVWLEV